MNGFQMLLVIVATNACVLGVALFVLHQFNKAVSRCGR